MDELESTNKFQRGFFAEVRTAYAVDETTLKYLMRKGKVREEVIDVMYEEALCDAYGWTPDYVRSMPDADFWTYIAVLLGKTDSAKNKQPKMPTGIRGRKKW